MRSCRGASSPGQSNAAETTCARRWAWRSSARGAAPAESVHRPELEIFGVLSPSRVAAVHARGLREVVTPCARELLSVDVPAQARQAR